MQKRFFLLSCCLIGALAFPRFANAQFDGLLKKVKDKAVEKATQAGTKAKDKLVDKALDAGTNMVTNAATSKSVDICEQLQQQSSNINYLNFKLASKSAYDFGGYGVDRFVENAQKVDYPNLKKQIASSNTADCEDLKERLMGFEAKFTNDFKTNGITGFNQMIDRAYQEHKLGNPTGKDAAAVWIDAAAQQIAAVKLVLPDHADVLAMEANVQKAEKSIKGSISKQIAASSTGAMHAKYAGKMKFSNKPIIPGKENEADFKTKFAPGEKIYGIAYFKKGIKQLPGGAKEDDWIYADVSSNGEPLFGTADIGEYNNMIKRRLTKDDVKNNITAWTFELIADEKTTTSSIPWLFAEMIEKLSPRKHTISLGMADWNDGGSFEIDLNGVDMEQLVPNAKAMSQKAAALAGQNRSVPDDWKKYDKGNFSDPQLSTAKIKEMLKNKLSNCQEVLRVHLIEYKGEPDWTIQKNDLDIPIAKNTADIGYVYKAKDGNCYMSYAYCVRTYSGGGQYEPVKIRVSDDESKYLLINCANAMK
jgi:hypothetical protein